jgi:hypothetical protein
MQRGSEPHQLEDDPMQDRYRVTLTLTTGELLILETWEEEEALTWARSQDPDRIKGRLIEKITTLVVD